MTRFWPAAFRTNTLEWRALKARSNAFGNLVQLGFTDHDYKHLTLFLRGRDPDFEIMSDMTIEDIKKLELLSGPHALTILKIGLLRRGISFKIRAK
jgi:hypothetical protein